MTPSPTISLGHTLFFCSALAIAAPLIACSDQKAAEPSMPTLPRNIAQALNASGEGAARPPLMPAPEPPRPAAIPPQQALSRIVGKALLPGDQIIAELLAVEMQGAQKPSYKSNVDYPFSDGAALAISEEVRQWIRRKMAALGFSETEGRPTLSWVVHVQPDADGQYRLETSLQSLGSVKFKKAFMVPEQYSAQRLDEVFAEDFVPGAPQ